MKTHRLFYSMEDMEKMTGFSRPKLYKLMYDGILPSQKVGRNRVFTPENIQIFLRNIRNNKAPSSDLASEKVL